LAASGCADLWGEWEREYLLLPEGEGKGERRTAGRSGDRATAARSNMQEKKKGGTHPKAE